MDTVILGCTHYPLVRAVIQRGLGRGVTIVSSGEAIADDVRASARRRGLANDESAAGSYRFLSTGDPEEFRRLGTRFLQLPARRGRTRLRTSAREGRAREARRPRRRATCARSAIEPGFVQHAPPARR